MRRLHKKHVRNVRVPLLSRRRTKDTAPDAIPFRASIVLAADNLSLVKNIAREERAHAAIRREEDRRRRST